MKTYVAFIRGINVGGHNKLPMADLRQTLTSNHFNNVSTYIQSGNVLFNSSKDAAILEKEFEQLLLEHFQLDVQVIIRTQKELKSILKEFPFPPEQITQSYFVLFKTIPKKEKVDKVKLIELPFDQFVIKSHTLYLLPEQGYGKSKFNLKRFEKILEVKSTARNYKTITKLVSLPLK
ncbi:DUF1697 domain-containing protein [Winogradskyella aurantiaca]|uniref:DUF1697 domain-containing protein n=1 Tax=Winogradskyella aurantiaca TaxID=2219558 RepID=UPI000E1D7DD3|nr:DUF1697 domain-containing protein [Winogradskyella aurantiaca]